MLHIAVPNPGKVKPVWRQTKSAIKQQERETSSIYRGRQFSIDLVKRKTYKLALLVLWCFFQSIKEKCISQGACVYSNELKKLCGDEAFIVFLHIL